MTLHPPFDAPARDWIEAGLATRSEKASAGDVENILFHEAEAKGFIYLTGQGAQILDREAHKRAARP